MRRLLIVALLVGMAACMGRMRFGREQSASGTGGEERDEMTRTYQLEPNAEVEVSGINGTVQVETVETKTAEVHIVRTARSREALNDHKVTVEQTPAGLVIRGESDNGSGWLQHLWRGNVRQQVMLKVPRQIALAARGVNGSVTVSEVDGPTKISGVNGNVQVTQASGQSNISGINGRVVVAVKQLDAGGLHLSGINGAVELRLADNLNASLEARGMNGKVTSDLPGVNVVSNDRSTYSAQIGSGGPQIAISGVNGGVRLTRAAVASSPSSPNPGS